MSVLDAINRAGGALAQYKDDEQNLPPSPSGSVDPTINARTTPAAPAGDAQGAGGGNVAPEPTAGGQTAGGQMPDYTKDRGTPDSKIPENVEEEIEKSIKHTANGTAGGALPQGDPDLAQLGVVDKKMKLNEALAAQGADPRKALEQLRDQRLARAEQLYKEGVIDKKYHTKLKDRWKNIFNVIPKEDMGMVLMDFGLRAMMAGETMGDMGALGAAGMGALQGVQQRKDQDYERKMKQQTMAEEGARRDLESITKAETAGKRGADTISTDQGIMKWNPETQSYDTPVLNPDGTPAKPAALTGRPPVDKWRIDQLIAMGYSPEKAKRFVILGQDPQRAREMAFSAWQAFERDENATITVGGKTYTKREVRRADIPNLREKFFNESLSVLGIGADDIGAGALSGGGQGGGANSGPTMYTREQLKEQLGREPTEQEWNEYTALFANPE